MRSERRASSACRKRTRGICFGRKLTFVAGNDPPAQAPRAPQFASAFLALQEAFSDFLRVGPEFSLQAARNSQPSPITRSRSPAASPPSVTTHRHPHQLLQPRSTYQSVSFFSVRRVKFEALRMNVRVLGVPSSALVARTSQLLPARRC